MNNEYGKLERLTNHPGFWVNPASGMIYWRGTVRGHRLKKSTGTTKIMEAKRTIEKFVMSLTAENLERAKRQKRGVRNPALKDLWNELIAEKQASKASATLKGYDSCWRHKIGPFWRDKHVSDLNQKRIIEFENWFLMTFPGQVFFNAGKHFRMFIKYLVREKYVEAGLVVRDLDKTINGQFKKKKHFRIYTPKEQEKLLACAVSPFVEIGMMAFLDTGMRKMELLSRKWEDLDWKARVLNVWSQKNKKWRKVPLTDRLFDKFKDYEAQSQGSDYIFPMKTNPNMHISSQLYDKDWVATKRAAGIKGKARVHDMRHTFATTTAKDGWPVPIACTVLDMSADEYMKTYVHINETDIATWLKRSFQR